MNCDLNTSESCLNPKNRKTIFGHFLLQSTSVEAKHTRSFIPVLPNSSKTCVKNCTFWPKASSSSYTALFMHSEGTVWPKASSSSHTRPFMHSKGTFWPKASSSSLHRHFSRILEEVHSLGLLTGYMKFQLLKLPLLS